MPTSAQMKANRENAKKSCGPTSEAGRQASSRNALRHGLTGHTFTLLECESAEEFDRVKADFEREHQPATPTESALVERMVQQYWLVQRCIAIQTSVMATMVDDSGFKCIDIYVRYEPPPAPVRQGLGNAAKSKSRKA